MQVFDEMDARTRTNHSFLLQIWHPKGLDRDHPNQPAIFLTNASGSSKQTIAVRDSHDSIQPLSEVLTRYWVPPVQGLRTQEWYRQQLQALPGRGVYQRMRMHVQGELVPDGDPGRSSHPWCRYIYLQ